MSSNWPQVLQKLEAAKTPEIVIRLFRRHYENLCSAGDRFVRESDITPTDNIADAETLDASFTQLGCDHLHRAAILKLNGGLGTSMGLDGPKSLLPVRGRDTFLDLILRQASRLSVPLVLMNSFSTQTQTDQAIEKFGSETVDVISFLQHQVPKIDAQTLAPVSWPAAPELQWCPPGHGDIYAALVTSGTLARLLDEGRRYLFVSNADNLGATLDPGILGAFIQSGKSFLMEVADRTIADQKGGHLAKTLAGKLLLRESAQCHPDEVREFQDITKHRYFNTNNLWIDLQALSDFLTSNDGELDLPTIVNRKTVDPKDPSSTAVFQLETAMGAAIEVLPETDAIRVPRSRFAPVKTTGDLLAVRSDAYKIRADDSVGLIQERAGKPPHVALDSHYFKILADLDQRFAATPSLRQCESLTVTGDLRFEGQIEILGQTSLIGGTSPATVPPGTYQGEHHFE